MNKLRFSAIVFGWLLGGAAIALSTGILPGQLAAAVIEPFEGSAVRAHLGAQAQAGSTIDGPAIFGQLPNGYAEPASAVDPHPGAADFSQEEALRRVGIVGGAAVVQTAGADHRNPETHELLHASIVDGHPISLSDLVLLEFRFLPQTTSYTTVADTFGGFRSPTDAWIAVWQRQGVAAPELPGKAATVRVVVVMEDATGTIRDVQVQKFDPAAVR